MRKSIISAATALMLAATVTGCASLDQSAGRPRCNGFVKQVVHRDGTVYRVDILHGFISSVTFIPGEAIEAIAVGQAKNWVVDGGSREVGDYISIKPIRNGLTTQMMVQTSLRTYVFELDSTVEGEGKPCTYGLNFVAPPEIETSLPPLQGDTA